MLRAEWGGSDNLVRLDCRAVVACSEMATGCHIWPTGLRGGGLCVVMCSELVHSVDPCGYNFIMGHARLATICILSQSVTSGRTRKLRPSIGITVVDQSGDEYHASCSRISPMLGSGLAENIGLDTATHFDDTKSGLIPARKCNRNSHQLRVREVF
ncbi:hypothetical protein BCV70DRAFT_105000 [Testicularia cyperi]|uniref:Uncharacterized protein n=1 Tax=Testicularia cyperi TaxID=1882483 RepID=A0A317XQD4_9BASI|nr:hypothetical protein BCV70DRAFT_105000 [Testicularia cyperi]